MIIEIINYFTHSSLFELRSKMGPSKQSFGTMGPLMHLENSSIWVLSDTTLDQLAQNPLCRVGLVTFGSRSATIDR